MENDEIASRLARIDERLEHVEDLCGTMNEKLFTGNGDSVITRLRLAEREITDLRNENDADSKGKFAVIMLFIGGFVSVLTSMGLKYLG